MRCIFRAVHVYSACIFRHGRYQATFGKQPVAGCYGRTASQGDSPLDWSGHVSDRRAKPSTSAVGA
eukprot:5590070-Prymnesium_polylepis.1